MKRTNRNLSMEFLSSDCDSLRARIAFRSFSK